MRLCAGYLGVSGSLSQRAERPRGQPKRPSSGAVALATFGKRLGTSPALHNRTCAARWAAALLARPTVPIDRPLTGATSARARARQTLLPNLDDPARCERCRSMDALSPKGVAHTGHSTVVPVLLPKVSSAGCHRVTHLFSGVAPSESSEREASRLPLARRCLSASSASSASHSSSVALASASSAATNSRRSAVAAAIACVRGSARGLVVAQAIGSAAASADRRECLHYPYP